MKKHSLIIAIFLLLNFNIFAQQNPKDTHIYIDISGSMTPFFQEVQNYITNEIIDNCQLGTNLRINKFYQKNVNIFDETIESEYTLKKAKALVKELKSNGPWTDLDQIFDEIKQNNYDKDNIFIISDGFEQLENYTKEYQITEENIKTLLKNAKIKNYNGKYFIFDFSEEEIKTQTPSQQPLQNETKQSDFPWWVIILMVGIVVIIVLIVIVLRGVKNNDGKDKGNVLSIANKSTQNFTVISHEDQKPYNPVEYSTNASSYGDYRWNLDGHLELDGVELHHIPSSESLGLKEQTPQYNCAVVIPMTKEDHENTASYGSSNEAKKYREKQKNLISQGKYKEAMQMDIDDIHKKFGNKYDDAIKKAVNYAKKQGWWND